MENDMFNVPVGLPNHNSDHSNEIPPHAFSVLLAQPNFVGLNYHQNSIIDGFPIIPMLQNETIIATPNSEDLHFAHRSDFSYSGPLPSLNAQWSSYPVNNSEVTISATELATMLAARYGADGSLDNRETSQVSAHPMDVQKQLSFDTSVNLGLNGTIGDMSSKCNYNNPLTLTELSGRIPGRLGLPEHSGWISSESTRVSSESPCSSRFSNELSLSLATCSDMNYSGVSSLSLNEQQRLGSEHSSCNSRNLSLTALGSQKPLQVLQLMSGSGYLQMMQEILAEIASYSLGSLENTSFCSSRTAGRNFEGTGTGDILDCNGRVDMLIEPVSRRQHSEAKKKHLLGLLQLVDDRYNQCVDEIHTVISAFHAVIELDPQLHARFTLQTASFFYKSLRDRISNHILAMGVDCNSRDRINEGSSYEMSFLPKQWALQQLKRKDQLWKPQRGLPEKSVAVLRAWMFQNFLHPYPKDTEKQLLAVKSGLSRSQVSNWFINARVRIWKPMIDEMYAEMKKRSGRQNGEDTEITNRNNINIIDGRF